MWRLCHRYIRRNNPSSDKYYISAYAPSFFRNSDKGFSNSRPPLLTSRERLDRDPDAENGRRAIAITHEYMETPDICSGGGDQAPAHIEL